MEERGVEGRRPEWLWEAEWWSGVEGSWWGVHTELVVEARSKPSITPCRENRSHIRAVNP